VLKSPPPQAVVLRISRASDNPARIANRKIGFRGEASDHEEDIEREGRNNSWYLGVLGY
jgi:hypothetical protein